MTQNLRTALSFLGEPKIKQKANNKTLIYRFDSEKITPVPLKLKVEFNCREHFSVFGYQEKTFSIENRWFIGTLSVLNIAHAKYTSTIGAL